MLRCPSCGLTAIEVSDREHRYANPVMECVDTRTAIACNLGKPVPSTLWRVVQPAMQIELIGNVTEALK